MSSTGTSSLLPPSLAWLEHATLEVSATQRRKGDVRYVLTVRHRPSRAKWALGRSFDEYRDFQRRLLAALRSGHFCQCECPWLFTFVTAYFPKSRLFRSSSARVIHFRREALQLYVTTIQSVLVNRANHSCAVLRDGAGAAFAEFLGADKLPLKLAAAFSVLRRSDSLDSHASTSDDEAPEDAAVCVCGVCDGQVARYRTTLRCGHHFHDECVVPKLNERLCCPTCGEPESF